MRVIPLYNYLVLPNALTYVPISSIEDPASELEIGARVVLICAKDSDLGSKSLEERFYPIGVTGTIIESDIQGYVAVATDKRVNIDVIAYEGDGLAVTYSDREGKHDLSDDERHERFIRMKAAITKMMAKSNAPDWWKNYVNKLDNIEKLTVASSIGMNIDNAERYAVLAIDSEKERSERMEQLVMEMEEISELNIQSRLDQNNRNQ
ncbi:MAG: hypothetical protein IKQ93_01000, partial [Candidatus Methanomethylophilaceae archaeon]|nr:hypothetical protein [Candidatus Methanomethylophilaceae archaeon]